MFGKAKIQNSNVWKFQNTEFQCLEMSKYRIPVCGNAKIQNSNVWEAKIQNSNVWKSQNREFQCFERQKYRIRMFENFLRQIFQCLGMPK